MTGRQWFLFCCRQRGLGCDCLCPGHSRNFGTCCTFQWNRLCFGRDSIWPETILYLFWEIWTKHSRWSCSRLILAVVFLFHRPAYRHLASFPRHPRKCSSFLILSTGQQGSSLFTAVGSHPKTWALFHSRTWAGTVWVQSCHSVWSWTTVSSSVCFLCGCYSRYSTHCFLLGTVLPACLLCFLRGRGVGSKIAQVCCYWLIRFSECR